MRKLCLLGMGFVFVFLFKLHATEGLSSQLTAVEQTALVPNSAIPKSGLFYSAKLAGEGMTAPIYPGAAGMSAWDLGNGAWLVDDLNPVVPVQNGMRTLDLSGPPTPPGAGTNTGGVYTNTFTPIPIDTNGLYLKIGSVAAGQVGLSLMNATDTVYAIWSSTNILSGWQIATALYPSVDTTNTLPFTVAAGGANLFWRAEDWTGVDANGDGIPENWVYFWFGDLNETANTLDALGNTLLDDYLYGDNVDPDIINFSLQTANNYVSTMNVPVQLDISAGVPAYLAVSVDDSNYLNDANWQNYTSSNLNVNLGLDEGWHGVWVGLKGPAPNATVTWQWKRLKLDYTPPTLVITNPTTSIVDEPVIQLQGYSPEALASISYDLSNALGVVADQPAGITDRYYDTNVWDFTTCYFECLDVPLTNGVNVITLRATDVAGNVTTTNFNVTLDYSGKTNPPVAQILCLANGTSISGTDFTLRGWLADPTATVTTQLLSTNDSVITTNVYAAEVERNGKFWLEDLPLNAGTNDFTLTITDAAGNTSVTNICVTQSSLVLTVNPVTPDSQLWQPTVNLTGTISDATYAVWVNGVKGHNNGNGTWSASQVPVNSGGTASFTATAYAPTELQPDGSYGN